MTPTPHTGNAEALFLADEIDDVFLDPIGLPARAAAMLRAQAQEIERLREALEDECGGRCNAEYNPCAARAALEGKA